MAITISGDGIPESSLQISNTPTNGQFLSAQSGNTGGLTWAAASGGSGDMVFISKTTVSSNVTSVDFTSLSGYNTYKVIFSAVHSSANSYDMFRCRIYDSGSEVTADGAYDYRTRNFSSSDNSAGQSQTFWGIMKGGSGAIFGELTFVTGTNIVSVFGQVSQATGSAVDISISAGSIDATVDSIASFDGIKIYPANNNITSGTFSLYGIKDS